MEKILVVDDNEVNRRMLCKILQDNYEVIEVDNGEAALDILINGKETVAAVLLDIVMPGMDGFDVLREIRNHSSLSELPVIIETENTQESFEMNALKAGATDFVVKPYKPEIIKARLKNIINTRNVLNQISNLSLDDLTGLMSLNQFYYEGSRWINENPDMSFDVVALDIVHFSTINDSKGIEGANRILKSIAARIKALQEKMMFFATRVYADRFIMLIQRQEGYPKRLIEEADAITAEYSDSMNVHIRYGIYEITEQDVKLPNVCGRAFSATNLIKDYYGNRYAYYDEKLHNQILFEEKINDDMEPGLRGGQFQIYFQPKFDIFTNAIAGAEALVRWMHPIEGTISPAVFIPVFEKNGFIVKLDQYVWDKAASEVAKWISEGNKVVPVSVNISRVDIETIDVIDVICSITDKYKLPPELLHLEITESAYMYDTDKIISVVTELKNRGFIIEMDDFGSGYSSLNMLAKLPINIIKLDMKFIQAIENSTNAKTIIEYTIGLAKWMNLPVIAEGVETEEQLRLLKNLECNYVQGYIFAKPMPENKFKELLMSPDPSIVEKYGGRLPSKPSDFIKKYNLLIVEDLPLNRSIIKSYFEETFNVIEACNGIEAMNYLQSGAKIDVIILDIYMPEMDGYEMLDRVKNNPEYKKIPVLVISAETKAEEEKTAYKHGADAFANKPFTSENIINKVRILMRNANILDEMNLWDIMDTISNPWIKDSCEDITVINAKTGRICRLTDGALADTDVTYQRIMSEEQFKRCTDYMENSGRHYMSIRDDRYLLNIQYIHMNDEWYIICFRINLNKAVTVPSII